MDKFIQKARKIKNKILKLLPQTFAYQFIISETELSTFRYANNQLTQNTNETNLDLTLILRNGKKEAVFSTNKLDDNGIERAVKKGLEILKFSPPDPELPPFPQNYSPTLEKREFSLNAPQKIIPTLNKINKLSQQNKLNAFGASHNEKNKLYIFNSEGLEIADNGDLNTITLITYNNDGLSGYAGEGYHDIEELDIENFFQRAALKCNYKALNITPSLGDYQVILEAPAVATMMNVLAFSAFSAGIYQEGRSFMSGKLGQKMFPDIINILDNPYHPKNRSLRIDYEGITKKKINFVEKGILKEVAHNTRTALKENTQSTGHAIQPPEKYPFPTNVMLDIGDKTISEMIAAVKKGLYITRFHYIGLVDETKTTITGMTRDGTFLIENGEIVGSIGDLRFTDDITRILQNTTMIENKLYEEPGFLYGANISPAILTNTFRITGFKPKEEK
jgi:PmbA protein